MAFRSLILHNFWLKAFSLFFAGLIYFAIQSSQSDFRFPTPFPSPELEVRCPVAVLDAPASHTAFQLEPAGVVVKVTGKDATLKKLVPETIQAYVRLIGVSNLRRSFRVEVIVPPEVTLKEVAPEQVFVQPADK